MLEPSSKNGSSVYLSGKTIQSDYMSFVPAPSPLTFAQFCCRYETGARTLFEIDPELGKWVKKQVRYQVFGWIVCSVGLLFVLSVLLLTR
jgi:hypothetical protein